MPILTADRVKETTTTTGTGTYSLAGAATGFRGFVAGIGSTNQCYYTVTDGTDWETGLGTVTDAGTDTLSRDTILASSNSGSAVSWSAGSKDVFVTFPAVLAGHHVIILRRNNSPQTISNVTVTAVSWDTETLDTAGQADISGSPTKVLTALAAGEVWSIDFGSRWSGTPTNGNLVQVRLYNSSNTLLERHENGPATTGNQNKAIRANATVRTRAAGDYITIEVYQDSAGNLDLADGDAAGFGDSDTYVSAVRVR